jgi:hypothetical protein
MNVDMSGDTGMKLDVDKDIVSMETDIDIDIDIDTDIAGQKMVKALKR